MFNKIKSLFIVEEEKQVSTPGKTVESGTSEVKKDIDKRMKRAGVSKSSMDQFLKVLADALEKNNIEGYDYLEYKEAIKSLKKLEEDEGKKFLTAYTLAKTMGAEKNALIESAGHYLKVLEKEDMKFQDALQKQINEKLKSGRQSIEQKKKMIDKKKAQLAKIQQEMQQMEKQVSALETEVSESANKVATIKNSFQQAYVSIKTQIEEDINKIKKYIN